MEDVLDHKDIIEDNFIHSGSQNIIEEEKLNSFNSSYLSSGSIHFISERQHISSEPFLSFDLIFLVNEKRIKQDIQLVSKCCPLILKVLKNSESKELKETTLVIDLPKEISENALHLFYTYNTLSSQMNYSDIIDIVIVAEYFENMSMLTKLFKEHLIPSINSTNVISYFITALKKINNSLEINNTKTNVLWRELMLHSHDIISKKINLIEKDDLIQLYNYDSKLFNELLQLFFNINNCSLHSNKEGNKQFFAALGKIYKYDNLLLIINSLYQEKFLNKEIEEFITSSLPTILDLRETYKEYEINLDNKDKAIFVSTSYQASTMKYDITINPSNINSCYMHSVLYITDATSGLSSKNFLANFSKWSNYSLNANSSMSIRKKSKMFLHIKIDYIFTALVNYVLKNIEEYYKSFHLINSDISLMMQMIFHMKAFGINQNIIIMAIMDWLNNINNVSQENIIALSEQLNWRDIKIELIIEYFIKYSHIIKKTLVNTLMKILKEAKIDKLANHLANNIGNTIYTNSSFKSENKRTQAITRCSNVVSIEIFANKKETSLYFKGDKTTKNDNYTITGGNNEETPSNSRGLSYMTTFTSQVAQFNTNKTRNESKMNHN